MPSSIHIIIKIVRRDVDMTEKTDKQPAFVELNISGGQKTSNKANTLLQMMLNGMKKTA